MRRTFVLVAAGLAILTAAPPAVLLAQGQAVAALSVGARVAPACSIRAESPATAAPSVLVICGRSALRALRVSTGADGNVQLLASAVGRQWLAGGAVVVTVPTLLATVASLRVIDALPAASPREPVVVTLDF